MRLCPACKSLVLVCSLFALLGCNPQPATQASVTLDFWAMLPVDAPRASAGRAGRVAGSLLRKAHDLLKATSKGKSESADKGESTDTDGAETISPDTNTDKVMARLIRDAQLLADLTKGGQMIDVDAWKVLNAALTKAGRQSHLLRSAADKSAQR